MRQRGQIRVPSEHEPVPAVICADREFSVWRKVKGAQFISAVALLFWCALFLAFFA